MSGPLTHPAWLAERIAEARAVMADVASHSDHLIRLASKVLVRHGETVTEREDARRLLVILDARRPTRSPRHDHDDLQARP